MPLQNRVNPKGEIVVSSRRGRLMGNRGCLHNAAKQIIRRSKIIHWVTCALEYKGIKRPLMAEGNYTELFFLDEATALAAGHRPCSTCRNKRYKEFTALWATVHGSGRFDRVAMDKTLHAERILADGCKVTYSDEIDDLPDGTCIEYGEEVHVVWRDQLLRWSFEGYTERRAKPMGIPVTVLTPRSTVAVLRAGYVPELHPTAGDGLR